VHGLLLGLLLGLQLGLSCVACLLSCCATIRSTCAVTSGSHKWHLHGGSLADVQLQVAACNGGNRLVQCQSWCSAVRARSEHRGNDKISWT
jgi:hypothetical protein